MATQKIEYQNKVAIDDVGVPEKNKITADNMNEIKEVVNNNADNADETTAAINSRIDTANNAINNIVENTYTKTETNEKLAQKADISDIPTDLSQLSNATTKFVNETQLQEETTARENTDNNLQGQIDAIVASSDVVDIVGTYQELQNYDTSHLGDNDIIKVLLDSTHNNATSYYRWKKHTSTWQYIGSEGPYYTKSESNEKFVEKETGKGLSSNDFTNAYRTKLDDIESGAEVNIIEKVKVNNTDLPIENKEVNIDLTDYVKNTDYATAQKGGVVKGNLNSFNVTSGGIPYGTTYTYSQYQTIDNANFISKGTLETVITGKQLINQTQLDTKQDKITSENAGNKIEIENSLLSSEYQQVEYIESSGGQYIDTGVKGNNNTRADISFRTKTVGNSQAVFGYFVGGYNKTLFLYSSGDKHFQVGYGAFQNLSDSWVDNTKYEISLSNGKIIINGTEMTITEASDFTTDENLLLFKISGSTGGGMPIQLYNFKIYNGDTLVRNFIPCYKISNNEIGLYDIVNNVFYTNAGTGTFTKGENINSNLKISVSQDFIDNYNKLKADHPPIEEEGTDLSLQGTGDFELALSPKGNITQETREGYNLLNPDDLEIFNANKYLSTKNFSTQGKISVEANQKYSMIFKTGLLSDMNYYEFDANNNKTSLSAVSSATVGNYNVRVFQFSSTAEKSSFYMGGNTAYSSLNEMLLTLELMFVKGDYSSATISTLPKYEPYGASPSPSYPSPVKVVDGEYEVEVENKNLVDFSDLTTLSNTSYSFNNDILTVTSTSGSYKYCRKDVLSLIKTNSGKTLKFVCDSYDFSNAGGDSANVIVQIIIINNGITSYSALLRKNGIYTSCIIPDDTSNITSANLIISSNNSASTESHSISITKPMLEFNTASSTPYTPHAQQTQTIDTSPNPLYSEDDLYFKAVNGDSFYDSLTSEQKASLDYGYWYVHNTKIKFNLSRVESFNHASGWINATAVSATTGINHGYSDYNNKIPLYCNRLIDDTPANIAAYKTNAIGIGGSGYTILLSIEGLTTSADYVTYFQNNETYLYLPLATPTNTKITNTTLINQLETFQNMLAYQDQTNISQTHNEAQADMIINAKTIMSMRYLQNEIEELKQAILNS